MERPFQEIDYDRFGHDLAAAGTDYSVAEIHGLLSGLLCGPEERALEHWFGELFSEGDAPSVLGGACRGHLTQLYTDTLKALRDPHLEFTLLLPADTGPLPQRLAALCEWCQGFLYGLGVTGVKMGKGLSDEAGEALGDLAEINRLDPEAADEGEESEEALAELEEFIKVAVLLLREELLHKGEA